MPGSSIGRDAVVGSVLGIGASAVAIVGPTEVPAGVLSAALSVVWRLEGLVSVPTWVRWAVLGGMIVALVLEVRRWRR